MLFNSIEYMLFLPAVFAIYWLLSGRGHKLQNLFVVAVSYIFYGWWSWRFLFLIALTTILSFALGIQTQRFLDNGLRKKAKACTALNITVNLTILGIFKYYDFFADSLAASLELIGISISPRSLHLVLPVGISFYTFQALSYTIDVYRGKIRATSDAVAFFAFISFFPQLVAGPIERAANLLPQFQRNRKFSYSSSVDGLRQILWGLFKKVVIADNCAEFVTAAFSGYSQQSGSTLAVASLLFAFQIYGDFSGYSDIAIGTAKLFGIRLRDNFLTPYFSRDVAEFWRRWHISLNKWFVDYVYIPLGGNRTTKTIRNVFAIFLLSGLWHGANWTFVAWGVYHALLFVPLMLSGNNRRHTGSIACGKTLPDIKELSMMLFTFITVVIGWILFRADSIADAACIISRIFSASLLAAPSSTVPMSRLIPTLVSIAVCIITEWANRDRRHGLDITWIKSVEIRMLAYYSLAAMIVLYSGKNITFIYFQF